MYNLEQNFNQQMLLHQNFNVNGEDDEDEIYGDEDLDEEFDDGESPSKY